MVMSSAAEQRQAVADLSSMAVAELVSVWPQVAGLDPVAAREVLVEALPDLFGPYGDAAASLAADWYEELRDEQRVAGRFRPTLAPEPVEDQWKALAGRAVGSLFGAAPRPDDALTILSGGLQRAVANQHRLTVVDSTKADPKAKGWKRVGVGHNCGFCNMLIGRGHVYRGDSVTFRAHDHCNCAASPVWADNVVYVTGEPYVQSQNRPRSDAALKARNKRAYQWMKDHG